MKKTLAHLPNRMKYFATALLAILLIAGLVPVGMNLLAKATEIEYSGHKTALSDDQVVLNGGNAMTLNQPVEAPVDIAAEQWVTYAYGDNTYAFQPQFPIAQGEKLTLTKDDTIQLDRKGEAPAGTTNITAIAELKSNAGGQVVFELRDKALMEADKLYYYDDGYSCYTFSTPKDLGYKEATNVDRYSYTAISEASRTNLNDKVNATSQGAEGDGRVTIVLNIDGETGTANFEGNQFTKHYIYERTTSLTSGNVYLIGHRSSRVNEKVQVYLASQEELESPDSTASTVKLGYETPGSDSTMWDMETDGIIRMPSSSHANYIDMADLTGEQYVSSEMLAQDGSTGGRNALTGPLNIKLPIANMNGIQFQGVTANKSAYSSDRAFGTDYTWSLSEQQVMKYSKYNEDSAVIGIEGVASGNLAMNNGKVWTLENSNGSYYLYNNNTFAGLQSGNNYLVVNNNSLSAASRSNAATPVYPYQLKVAYKQETATLSNDLKLVAQSKTKTDFAATRMEKVTGTFEYIGIQGSGKTFDITYNLTDENDQRVSGTFGDVSFENGVGIKTRVKSGDDFSLGWIPEGYKLATTSVLPSDTSDPDAERYQKNITYKDGTGTHDWAEGNRNAFVVGAAPTALRYELDDPLRNVKIALSHDGSGTHSNDTYDVNLFVTDRNGNPYNSEFHDSLGRTYSFVNGYPDDATKKILHLGNKRNFTLVDVPNGFTIQLTSESTELANINIDEGNLGASRATLLKQGGTETIGERVTTWTVQPIKVDADEDFLINIKYQNYSTTISYYFGGVDTSEIWWGYTYTFYVRQKSDTGYEIVKDIDVKDVSYNSKYASSVKANSDGSYSISNAPFYDNGPSNRNTRTQKETMLNNQFTISNIPPDAEIYVEYNTKAEFEGYRNCVLKLTVDSELIDITKRQSTGQLVYSLPRLTPSFQLDPSQPSHDLYDVFDLNGILPRFTINTTLLHGDPDLEVPVNLAGVTITQSGSTTSLSNSKVVYSNTYGKSALTIEHEKTDETTSKQYAVGTNAASGVGKIQRDGKGVSMAMEDSLKLSFTTAAANGANTYLSPFIQTTTNNANGVPYNTIGSELVAQPGYRLVDIIFKDKQTKTLSNSSVDYDAFSHDKDEDTAIQIIYDIIPQEVHISLYTGKNDGGKDYANRQKKFPVNIVLLNSSDMPVYDQIYEYTDENGNDGYLFFDSDEGVQILENVQTDDRGKITSYDKTGKKPELKHGDEIVLKLPYQYTVVVKEEDPGNYTDTYQSWTDTAPEKVEQNRVKVDSVLESQNSYLQITNTRNDVEDDIGLFGGKANRAFLALVAILSLIAAIAYLYSRRTRELKG